MALESVSWAGFVHCPITEELEGELLTHVTSYIQESHEWVEAMLADGYLFSIKTIEDQDYYVASLYGCQKGHKHAGMKLTAEAESIDLAYATLWTKYLALNGVWHVQAASKARPKYR